MNVCCMKVRRMGKLGKDIVMTEEEKEKHAESLKIGNTEVEEISEHSIRNFFIF